MSSSKTGAPFGVSLESIRPASPIDFCSCQFIPPQNPGYFRQILFPAALRHFHADDWLAIDAITARVQHDPLQPTSTEDRFAQLRRVIAAEADCGCEPEPAPGEFARPGA